MDTFNKSVTINVPIMANGVATEPIPSVMLELFTLSLTNTMKDTSFLFTFDEKGTNKDVWTWRPEVGTLAIKGKIHKVRTPVLDIAKNGKDSLELLSELDIPYGVKILYIDCKQFLSDKKSIERVTKPDFVVVVPDNLELPTTTKARLIKLPNFRFASGGSSTIVAAISDAAILSPEKVLHKMWFSGSVFYPYRTTDNSRICKTLENYLQQGFPRDTNSFNYAMNVENPEAVLLYLTTLFDILKNADVI